jgi:hypothetical protein
MSNPRQSAVVLVPDDGQGYAPGAPFNVVRTAGHVALIPDPRGAYEVYSSEPAPGLSRDPLLRVVLRKV